MMLIMRMLMCTVAGAGDGASAGDDVVGGADYADDAVEDDAAADVVNAD